MLDSLEPPLSMGGGAWRPKIPPVHGTTPEPFIPTTLFESTILLRLHHALIRSYTLNLHHSQPDKNVLDEQLTAYEILVPDNLQGPAKRPLLRTTLSI